MKKKHIFIPTIFLVTMVFLPHYAHAAATFNDIFGTTCSTYDCWFKDLWNWAIVIVIPLSTLMIGWAGFLWMTSAGNPDRVSTAKKIITGVVSGLLLLIFARVFIVNILGLDSKFWNTNTGTPATQQQNNTVPNATSTPSSPSGSGGGATSGGGNGGGGGGGGAN